MAKFKVDIRSGLMLILAILTIIGLPYALWSDHIDDNNLKKRTKSTVSRIIGLRGLKKNTVVIEYYIKNQRIEQVRSAPSIARIRLGDSLKINYDSLNYENIQIIWPIQNK